MRWPWRPPYLDPVRPRRRGAAVPVLQRERPQVRAASQPLRPVLAHLQQARAPGDPGQRRRAGPGADRPGRPHARAWLGVAAQGAPRGHLCIRPALFRQVGWQLAPRWAGRRSAWAARRAFELGSGCSCSMPCGGLHGGGFEATPAVNQCVMGIQRGNRLAALAIAGAAPRSLGTEVLSIATRRSCILPARDQRSAGSAYSLGGRRCMWCHTSSSTPGSSPSRCCSTRAPANSAPLHAFCVSGRRSSQRTGMSSKGSAWAAAAHRPLCHIPMPRYCWAWRVCGRAHGAARNRAPGFGSQAPGAAALRGERVGLAARRAGHHGPLLWAPGPRVPPHRRHARAPPCPTLTSALWGRTTAPQPAALLATYRRLRRRRALIRHRLHCWHVPAWKSCPDWRLGKDQRSDGVKACECGGLVQAWTPSP